MVHALRQGRTSKAELVEALHVVRRRLGRGENPSRVDVRSEQSARMNGKHNLTVLRQSTKLSSVLATCTNLCNGYAIGNSPVGHTVPSIESMATGQHGRSIGLPGAASISPGQFGLGAAGDSYASAAPSLSTASRAWLQIVSCALHSVVREATLRQFSCTVSD